LQVLPLIPGLCANRATKVFTQRRIRAAFAAVAAHASRFRILVVRQSLPGKPNSCWASETPNERQAEETSRLDRWRITKLGTGCAGLFGRHRNGLSVPTAQGIGDGFGQRSIRLSGTAGASGKAKFSRHVQLSYGLPKLRGLPCHAWLSQGIHKFRGLASYTFYSLSCS
jgi:hypothetical protein